MSKPRFLFVLFVVAIAGLTLSPSIASAQTVLNCPAGDGAVISNTGNSNKSPDLNQNGTVSIADFVLFQAAFLTNDYCADFDGNGVVGLRDFVLFQAHFFHSGVQGFCI